MLPCHLEGRRAISRRQAGPANGGTRTNENKREQARTSPTLTAFSRKTPGWRKNRSVMSGMRPSSGFGVSRSSRICESSVPKLMDGDQDPVGFWCPQACR
eukprot:scaffold1541_cov256-Pinguiococcus_pyrenoidosus.AAC.45